MLDVALLGTGGMMPLPDRFLTSLMVRLEGKLFLIDCGEGTQVSMKLLGWGYKQIGVICFTHFHADHISGLPGLLLAIANAGRTEPLIMIGPAGLSRVVRNLCVITPVLPFPIECHEIEGKSADFCFHNLQIASCAVEHGIPCYAYSMELERQGRFDTDRARALAIPVHYWSMLQKGEAVQYAGKTFLPADVLGEKRKGLKLCYATDLRPSDRLAAFASGSDLFICEGNYGDPDKKVKAAEHKHCLFSEAAVMAKNAAVKELWLTHFSPSMPNPEDYLHHARDIFEDTVVGYDRIHKTLAFDSPVEGRRKSAE